MILFNNNQNKVAQQMFSGRHVCTSVIIMTNKTASKLSLIYLVMNCINECYKIHGLCQRRSQLNILTGT